ncbi:MAG: hypothetical protein IIB81_02210 [Nanoarchaeota archaeon]|nr:hypothetical protein [Nanoarchaeota archaeon]
MNIELFCIMNLLIIKLGAIGDVIRTTIILSALKEKFNCQIDWVTKKESFDVLKNDSMINNIYLIESNDLENKKYDLVINLDDDKNACELANKIESGKILGSFTE